MLNLLNFFKSPPKTEAKTYRLLELIPSGVLDSVARQVNEQTRYTDVTIKNALVTAFYNVEYRNPDDVQLAKRISKEIRAYMATNDRKRLRKLLSDLESQK